jgi:cytochrome bd-type quinol oxidase subunit 2
VDLLYNVLVVLHFIGLASLIGGWLVQMSARGERRVSPAMMHGVLTLLVTGILLVGLASGVESLDRDVDSTRAIVKLVVALVIAVLIWVNRRRPSVPEGLYLVIGLLSIANVVIAVFW